MSNPTAEKKLMLGINDVCPANPHKGSCCVHYEKASNAFGVQHNGK